MNADIRLTNGLLLTPEGLTAGTQGIAITDGKICAIGSADSLPPAEETIDVGGAIIAPGMVDEHVHDRSLGQTHKEDWETLTRAAAAGGVTTVLGHGNTDPFIDNPAHVNEKLDRASRDALVDFGCFAWITPDNYDELEPLTSSDAIALQSSLSERRLTSGQLLTAMNHCADVDCRLAIHVGDGTITDKCEKGLRKEGVDSPTAHGRRRPPITEIAGAATVVELLKKADCPLHVFQVSTGSALEHLQRAKSAGLDISIETCPHYLWFTEEAVEEQGSVAVVSPPLRSESERNLLWERGIDTGLIDCIGTDHAPHTDAEKLVDQPFGSLWDISHGFVGLETAVPAMLTFASEGRITYPEWVQLYSTAPAKTWDLYPEKGSLQIGTDADLVIVDPESEWTANSEDLHSKGTVTPFDGTTFTGEVLATFVRGNLVYQDGTVLGTPGDGKIVN